MAQGFFLMDDLLLVRWNTCFSLVLFTTVCLFFCRKTKSVYYIYTDRFIWNYMLKDHLPINLRATHLGWFDKAELGFYSNFFYFAVWPMIEETKTCCNKTGENEELCNHGYWSSWRYTFVFE